MSKRCRKVRKVLPCGFRTDFARKAASPSELGDVNATRKEKPVKELPSVAKAGEVWMGLVALQSFLGSGLPMSPSLPAVRTCKNNTATTSTRPSADVSTCHYRPTLSIYSITSRKRSQRYSSDTMQDFLLSTMLEPEPHQDCHFEGVPWYPPFSYTPTFQSNLHSCL